MKPIKTLTGNSGDTVIRIDDAVLKIAGNNPDAFNKQIDFLRECKHPNFVKIQEINKHSYAMPYYEKTYFDWIQENKADVKKCAKKFSDLLLIVSRMTKNNSDVVNIQSYFDKLHQRTGLNFVTTPDFDLQLSNNFGFVHGDLTISNILLDEKENFIFIDPRGTPEHEYYDWGKLAQSVYSKYELFLMGGSNDTELHHVYDIMGKEFTHFIKLQKNSKQLEFFYAVHLIGAYPFFKANNRPYADLFLNKGLQIFSGLNIAVD